MQTRAETKTGGDRTQQIAKKFGCTQEQVRAQFAKNRRQLGAMAGKAGNGKLNGFTAEQLHVMAATHGV